MNNYEFYKNMVERTNLDKIFNLAAEEIITAIPKEVMPEDMKSTVKKATDVIIPVITGIYKNAFLAVYEKEFTDEEFGQLFRYYGPGSALWSFFNTTDFFPWLRKTIRECIQERIKGLDLASMSSEEFQKLSMVSLEELLDKLPEEIKAESSDYTKSDICHREAELGDKITAEGNRLMAEVDWNNLLEKSGITLPD